MKTSEGPQLTRGQCNIDGADDCTYSEMSIRPSGLEIVNIDVNDIRFPTSLGAHGSDALVGDTIIIMLY